MGRGTKNALAKSPRVGNVLTIFYDGRTFARLTQEITELLVEHLRLLCQRRRVGRRENHSNSCCHNAADKV
jgi:hypothetical protein